MLEADCQEDLCIFAESFDAGNLCMIANIWDDPQKESDSEPQLSWQQDLPLHLHCWDG